MAKNYSLTEAVQVIVENEDAHALVELGKRFPLLVGKVTRIAAKAGEEFNDLMQFLPDNLSANKVNQSIKRSLEESAEDEDFDDADDTDDEDVEETPRKAAGKGKKAAKSEDVGDTDYDSWNNAKMYKLLGEIGKRKDCKEKYGDLSHDSMLKYLKKYGPGSAAAEDDEDEEEDSPSYEGMKAVELYKLCKERKIKADKQKPAKYYIGLLKKADEAAEAEDEEWDEDEDVEETPKKGKEKATGKGKGKSAKKEEEDDDEDWDI